MMPHVVLLLTTLLCSTSASATSAHLSSSSALLRGAGSSKGALAGSAIKLIDDPDGRPSLISISRSLADAADDAQATGAVDYDPWANFLPNPIDGVPQSWGMFNSWVKFTFWVQGAWMVSAGDTKVVRYSTGSQYLDNRNASNFKVVSADVSKNISNQVLVGNQFRLRLLGTPRDDMFVYRGTDTKLYVGADADLESSTFEIQIKHAEKCPINNCIGMPVADADTFGQKLIHSATRAVCGGDVNAQAVCGGGAVNNWKNYMLTMGG